ncbi:MAG: Mpo1-like protein [Burkholderiales bacterium]
MSQAETQAKRYASFAEFYPFYLSEHANQTCRRLHFVGTSLGLACLVTALVTLNAWWLLVGLLVGYAFAWVGHFVFEKNRPATFTYPLWSFMGDWVMWSEILRGRIRF